MQRKNPATIVSLDVLKFQKRRNWTGSYFTTPIFSMGQ